MKKYILILIAVLFTVPLFAMTQEASTIDAGTIVTWLTPFIVLGATALVKKVAGISGAIVLAAVPVLSGIVTWVTGLLTNPALGFWEQFGLGIGAVFIHQVYVQLSEKK